MCAFSHFRVHFEKTCTRFRVFGYIFPYFCGDKFQIIKTMWIIIAIVLLVIIIGVSKSQSANQKTENVTTTTQTEPVSVTDDEDDGRTQKLEELRKEVVKLIVDSVSSSEITNYEKRKLIIQGCNIFEDNPEVDEVKSMKEAIRALYKKLLKDVDDLVLKSEIEEAFEEEKEFLKDSDYLPREETWDNLVDFFDKVNGKPKRQIGVSVVETRTEESDGVECEVANFAVKGLYFREKEDQEAACTLQVGDHLIMEPENGNPKDPFAIKVYMADGHHIGYVDAKCSQYVRENMDRMVKFVASKVTDDAIPYIYAEAFFRKK